MGSRKRTVAPARVAIALAVSIGMVGCATVENGPERTSLVAATAFTVVVGIVLALPVTIGITEIVTGWPVDVGDTGMTMSKSPYPPEQVASYIRDDVLQGDKAAMECLRGLHINWIEWSDSIAEKARLDREPEAEENPVPTAPCSPATVDAVYYPGMDIDASSLARRLLELEQQK